MKIACSYDFIGDDNKWHHHGSDYIAQGAYVVAPHSTYTSANFDETEHDLLITREKVRNISCGIMNGFLSSPSSYTVPQ